MNDLNKHLVEAIRRGDEDAFETVFHEYYNPLFNFACHYVIEKEVAREMVQDTFMILWENRSCLKQDTKLKSWLYTITRNNSLNYLKHLLVQKKHSETVRKRLVSYQLNYAALKDETSEQILFSELNKGVSQAIEKLPPKCREIFVLSRSGGLKHKEIANQLNISLKTVENQISEALSRIRTYLHEYLA
jgi:RNA polymerase sigma-70 factor (ECF subfamily)